MTNVLFGRLALSLFTVTCSPCPNDECIVWKAGTFILNKLDGRLDEGQRSIAVVVPKKSPTFQPTFCHVIRPVGEKLTGIPGCKDVESNWYVKMALVKLYKKKS